MATGGGTDPSVAIPAVSSGNTSIDIPPTYNPQAKDVLVIKGTSMLDAIFIKKSRGKPAYITTTSDSSTTLWQVGPAGELHEAAKILWETRSSAVARNANEGAGPSTVAGTSIIVSRGGQDEDADVYGQRSKGIFSRSYCTLAIDGRKYSWHSGIGSAKWSAPPTSVVDGWKCLVAADVPPDYDFGPSAPVSPSVDDIEMNNNPSRPDATRTVASTVEPVNDVGEATSPIPHRSSFRETFLISAILLAAKPGEWRHNQSTTHPREMETVLRSDHAGDLPPYLPSTPGGGSRAGAEPGVTAGGQRPSHNLHRTIPDSRQWRWGPDFTPGGRGQRSDSNSERSRTE